ncbi:MAG: transglycosylase domain-containing protein [Spirochaetes bacterium]|nr:transglycosylase domain-containing protein [Spirochaetota bacterium]
MISPFNTIFYKYRACALGLNVFFKNNKIRLILKIVSFLSAAVLLFHAVFIVVFFIISFFLNFINPPFSNIMYYRKINYNQNIEKIKFIPLEKIPKKIINMVVGIEDYKFFEHNGVDVAALNEAMAVNKELGYAYRGGSTITQQLARTLFLSPKKLYLRKYLEIIIAVEMEIALPKERILELYLNYAEWGNGIFGVETASYKYYKKSVNKLSGDQLARLVTILSSPLRYSPYNFGSRKILIQRYQNLLRYY